MFVLSNHWLETLDYTRHRITLNNHTAKLEPDGTVKLIVAARDPGHPNWLDTAGHARGTIGVRWVGQGRRRRDPERARGEALRRRLAALAVGLWLSVGSAAGARPVVILLSFDGVRHDYLDRDTLPAFERIAREGARAEALLPIFPSTTFPNHVALATGAHADATASSPTNSSTRRSARSTTATTRASSTPSRSGPLPNGKACRRAVFFWVGSETDWRGTGARYRKAPFDGRIGEDARRSRRSSPGSICPRPSGPAW